MPHTPPSQHGHQIKANVDRLKSQRKQIEAIMKAAADKVMRRINHSK